MQRFRAEKSSFAENKLGAVRSTSAVAVLDGIVAPVLSPFDRMIVRVPRCANGKLEIRQMDSQQFHPAEDRSPDHGNLHPSVILRWMPRQYLFHGFRSARTKRRLFRFID